MRSPPNREITIEIHDLEVRRGGRRVLPGISLEVARGTVTGLLGPSGSGKTTLMRAIVGLQIVRGGRVAVLGIPAGTPELRRKVGYVTQAPSVYGDLTVEENLEYFAGIFGADAAAIGRALGAVGLEPRARQVVGTMSGGERSRCSLAAALLGEPEVLVLDEPTVGLDPVLRQDLWRGFHALARNGTTVVVSTHVMDEAERCDELILMREGQIVAVAPPAELLARTRSRNLEQAFINLAEAS